MIIQASNGCYLTETVDVPIDKRRFFKSIEVSSYAEASEWIEITEREMRTMQAQAELINPNKIDYEYLCRLDTAVSNLHEIINDVSLTDDQALSLSKYYPKYEDEIGQYRNSGYKMQYEGKLVEVVTPHTISVDISPMKQAMTLDNMVQRNDSAEADALKYNTQVTLTSVPSPSVKDGKVVVSDTENLDETIVTPVEPIIYYRIIEPTPATLEEPAVEQESEK